MRMIASTVESHVTHFHQTSQALTVAKTLAVNKSKVTELDEAYTRERSNTTKVGGITF